MLGSYSCLYHNIQLWGKDEEARNPYHWAFDSLHINSMVYSCPQNHQPHDEWWSIKWVKNIEKGHLLTVNIVCFRLFYISPWSWENFLSWLTAQEKSVIAIYYLLQLLSEEVKYVTNMVRKDVLRTDRHHPYFSGPDDNTNIQSLSNILTTWVSSWLRRRCTLLVSNMLAATQVLLRHASHHW